MTYCSGSLKDFDLSSISFFRLSLSTAILFSSISLFIKTPNLTLFKALKRVRLGVLINKLIEENNIAVDKDSLKKEIEDKSKSFKDPEQYVNWIYGNEEQLKNIESLVLEDKVAEYLENKSKVDEEELSFEEVVSMG